MAQRVTLHKEATGHTVTTDDPETISNLQFGQGYRIVPTPATPEEPPAEPPAKTPPAEPPAETPGPLTAAMRPTAERKR